MWYSNVCLSVHDHIIKFWLYGQVFMSTCKTFWYSRKTLKLPVSYLTALPCMIIIFLPFFFLSVRNCVLNWLGISSVLSSNIAMHSHKFCGFIMLLKRIIMTAYHGIWLACTLVMAFECNYWFFNHKDLSLAQILDSVKVLVWWWINAKFKTFAYNLNLWFYQSSFLSWLQGFLM